MSTYNTNDIDEISDSMNYVYIDDSYLPDTHDNGKQELASYINAQKIDQYIKELVISLIDNDDYNSYSDIYNICLDNNIELPPLI